MVQERSGDPIIVACRSWRECLGRISGFHQNALLLTPYRKTKISSMKYSAPYDHFITKHFKFDKNTFDGGTDLALHCQNYNRIKGLSRPR